MKSNTQIFQSPSPLPDYQIPYPTTEDCVKWKQFMMMDNTYVSTGTGTSSSRLGGDNGGIAERSERSSRISRTLLAVAWESPLLIPTFREDKTPESIGLEELLLSTDDKNWSLASVFWTADEITELKMPEFLNPWIMTCT